MEISFTEGLIIALFVSLLPFAVLIMSETGDFFEVGLVYFIFVLVMLLLIIFMSFREEGV